MAAEIIAHGLTAQGWVELFRFPVTAETAWKGLTARIVHAGHELGACGVSVQIVPVEARTSGAVLDEAQLCCRAFAPGAKVEGPRAGEGREGAGRQPGPCGLPLIRRGLKFHPGERRAECDS
jgi:hypothetical protein